MNGKHSDAAPAPTEDGGCGHTPLFAQDPVRWVERVTPCPYCEIERLKTELANEKHRSFHHGEISFRGFGYNVGSQFGIDSLKRAIWKAEFGE